MKRSTMRRLLVSTVTLLLSAGSVIAQTIPASLAAPPNSINTNAPGFKVRVFRVTGLQVNHVDIAEGLISGTRINPATGIPYENFADPGENPDGSFNVTTVVNWDQGAAASGAGNFPNDSLFPGIPGPADDFVVEVTGWLQLPAGNHRIGVNSDDGFKFTIGTGLNPWDAFALRFPGIDTTRSQANTEYNITVQTAGFYPYRLLYWERSGDGRLEFFNFPPGTQSGTRFLVNDSVANAFKSFREPLTPFTKPYALSLEPASASTGASPAPFIRVVMQEQDSTVNLASAKLSIGSTALPTTATRDGSRVIITAQVPNPLPPNSQQTATLAYQISTGENVTSSWQFTVSNYPSVPASLAVASVDTSKPGFKARVYQMPHPRYPGNRGLAANADKALSLGYKSPFTGEPWPNTASPDQAVVDGFEIDADGSYIERNVINWNDGAAGGGSFPDNQTPVPGIPGIELLSDLYVAEIKTYLELKAGAYRFGVNSDDGFRLQAGHDAGGLILGQHNGTRGVADTLFDFVIPADGFYPFRLVFSDNTGGGACEWFVVQVATGEKTLINDTSGSSPAQVIKAYRESPVSRPAITRLLPAQNDLFVAADQDLIIEITDGARAVNAGSVKLQINGSDATVAISKEGQVTKILRSGSLNNLLPSGVNDLRLVYSITEDGNTVNITNSWSYTVPPYTRPIPPANKVAASSVSGSGFIARSHQIDRSGDGNQGNGGRYTGNGGGGNNMPRPEIQFHNGYINRATGQPYPNLAQRGSNADGSFLVDFLNFNGVGTANSGVFNGDNSGTPVPGLPGSGSSQGGIDNFVQEIQTYLELKAGAHLFGVNLDDGFIMSSAPNPRDTLGTLLGMRNPGGGNANPLSEPNAYAGVFNVIVPEDGIYPIRLLWWQGGGGVNIEFMTIDKHTGVETMVNDPNRFAPHQANPPPFEFPYNSIVAYSDYNGPVRPWVKFSVYPLSSLWQNQHQQGGPGPILVKVAGGNPADIANDVPTIRPFGDAVGAIVADLGTGSVGMILNGQSVTPTVTSLPGSSDKLVTYTPPQPLDPSQTHTAGLVYAGSTNYWTFNVITNVALQSDVAIAADRLDTSKVGFRVKVAQAASGQPNTVARAEAQLSGTPASVAIPGPQPDGSYIVPGIINWNVSKNPGNTASEIGNFQPAMNGMADEPVPGIPGTGLSGAARFENISAEIFAYLDLPAGYQKFGVNGDDGWKVQIGTPGQTNGPILFSVDRGAGARDIPFAFITPQAGLYPVRLVWYQGGGGGNLEFFTYGPDNSKIPVNDRNNPLAVKAYYEVQTSLPDPQITGISISGSTITISWTGGGTLETASSLPADSWTSTGNNSGSFSTTASASQTYFRVKR